MVDASGESKAKAEDKVNSSNVVIPLGASDPVASNANKGIIQ